MRTMLYCTTTDDVNVVLSVDWHTLADEMGHAIAHADALRLDATDGRTVVSVPLTEASDAPVIMPASMGVLNADGAPLTLTLRFRDNTRLKTLMDAVEVGITNYIDGSDGAESMRKLYMALKSLYDAAPDSTDYVNAGVLTEGGD